MRGQPLPVFQPPAEAGACPQTSVTGNDTDHAAADTLCANVRKATSRHVAESWLRACACCVRPGVLHCRALLEAEFSSAGWDCWGWCGTGVALRGPPGSAQLHGDAFRILPLVPKRSSPQLCGCARGKAGCFLLPRRGTGSIHCHTPACGRSDP